MNKIRHNFTLLEILVAVAVLVIMMGFLFQFVISAQRVWAASTARTDMADQANAIFQLLGEDINQVITVAENEDLDSVMGWHCAPDPNSSNPGNLQRLCFFCTDRDESNGAIYGVMYYYLPYDEDTEKTAPGTTGKLYRRRTDDPTWAQIGAEYWLEDASTHTYSLTDFGFDANDDNLADPDSHLDYLVAENITEFKVQTPGDTNTVVLPKFLRVTIKVKVPTELANTAKGDQVMDRTFSRVFFLDHGK